MLSIIWGAFVVAMVVLNVAVVVLFFGALALGVASKVIGAARGEGSLKK